LLLSVPKEKKETLEVKLGGYEVIIQILEISMFIVTTNYLRTPRV